MKILRDYAGTKIRLTDERMVHVLSHPEMLGLEKRIAETLSKPELVVQSQSDQSARLYYRYYRRTRVGDKYLCVVAKTGTQDSFVVTAYLTDKPKRGLTIWSAKQ